MNRCLTAACLAACGFAIVGATPGIAALPSDPGPLGVEAAGSSILMGVAVAALVQTKEQQDADRAAILKRLRWLMDNRQEGNLDQNDNLPRIVRVVFDVGPDGRATNVRVGRRSGKRSADVAAHRMISRFDKLPGGERRRVCAIVQYGTIGQDPLEPAFVKALKDEEASAITDLQAGRDGPQYDRRGRIIS